MKPLTFTWYPMFPKKFSQRWNCVKSFSTCLEKTVKKRIRKKAKRNICNWFCWNLQKTTKICLIPAVSCKIWPQRDLGQSCSTRAGNTLFKKVCGDKPKSIYFNRLCCNMLVNNKICLIPDVSFKIMPERDLDQVLLNSCGKHRF